MVLADHLLQSAAKIAYQAAADTTGIHLGNVDTGFLEETTVDTDLAEFVFNENQLLTLVSLGNHLLDEGSFTGTQKTGININLCHSLHLSFDTTFSKFYPKEYYTTIF